MTCGYLLPYSFTFGVIRHVVLQLISSDLYNVVRHNKLVKSNIAWYMFLPSLIIFMH